MPSVIANEFGEARGLWRAALVGLGVTLFVITILINLAARGFVNRSIRRVAGPGMSSAAGHRAIDLSPRRSGRSVRNGAGHRA